MQHYKIHVCDRKYNEWIIRDAVTMEKLNIADFTHINPIENKLLCGDIFKIVDGRAVTIHSTLKNTKHISGVLVLNTKITYGKFKNKHLYKCIPDDKRLPEFVIAYKPQIKFNKKMNNKYITFRFLHWRKKHPFGQIVVNIGDVTDLPNFYEYQMYCKSLYASIANMKKKTRSLFQIHDEEWYIQKILEKHGNIEDRTSRENIITIDSKGSKDLDDAFGYKYIDDNIVMVSIYISNVTVWFDVLDLWESFTNRISTIYLPDRKRPMLPTLLSDNICSLLEGKERFVFALDILLDIETKTVKSYEFKNCLIKVVKNHHHKTETLENCEIYKKMKDLAFILNKTKKYLDSVSNSNEIVAYYMVFMNYITALEMKKYETGIYRFSNFNENYEAPKEATKEIKKFLKIWHSMGGKYCKFQNIQEHQMLNLDSYLHITSPNRRLVDMINMIIIQENLGLMQPTEKSKKFYDKWTSDEMIEYINNTMRSIRKVQSDCKLLHVCSTEKRLTKQPLRGYIFDKLLRNDDLFQYIVYLPEIKMTNRITTTRDLKNLSSYNFKIYIFMDEIRLKQKIRLLIQD